MTPWGIFSPNPFMKSAIFLSTFGVLPLVLFSLTFVLFGEIAPC